MAKISRAFQKIFSDGITATGNVAVFGSLAAGSPAYSKDPDAIQSLAAWGNGWIDATIGNNSPAYQDFNGFQYLVTRQIAYVLQAGIPEWNSQTSYYIGSFCQVSGVIYRSKTNDNLNNSVGENSNWGILLSNVATSGSYTDLNNKPDSQQARSWVNFNGQAAVGTNMTIRSSYNVSSVFRVSIGVYRINFTSPMPNANYSVQCTGSTSLGDFPAVLGEHISSNSYVQKTVNSVQIISTVNDDTPSPISVFSGNVMILSTD